MIQINVTTKIKINHFNFSVQWDIIKYDNLKKMGFLILPNYPSL